MLLELVSVVDGAVGESDWFGYGGERMREVMVMIAINGDEGCSGGRR